MRRMLVAVLMIMSFGCGEPSVTTEADEPGDEQAPAATEQSQSAAVGDPITLQGSDDALKVRVTVVSVVDPAQGGDEFTQPGEGNRFVAVQLRLENVGDAVYDDSPSNGATLIDAEGQSFDSTLLETNAGPDLGSPTINKGDSRLGYVSFEVPTTSQITRFQFGLDSGFADQKGEWTLG